MKILAKSIDKTEAYALKLKLELLGIPIYLANEHSGPGVGALIGADAYTLWVEIDEQLLCAQKALESDSYVPKNPIDMEEFRSLQENTLQRVRNKCRKLGNIRSTL